MPAARTKRSAGNGPLCVPYSSLFQNGGYCKDIIDNLLVFGKNERELQGNENKLHNFAKITKENKVIISRFVDIRKSCLERVDDIYCHHYFKRCYLSSAPQTVRREACEDLMFNVCDQEIKTALEFNRNRPKLFYWKYYWDIINCTTLPSRNESSNCYYPDKTRGQYGKKG